MFKLLWNALKVSPVVLGAFLFVSGSAGATQNAIAQKIIATNNETLASVEPIVESDIQLSKATVENISTSQVEPSIQLSEAIVEDTAVSQATPGPESKLVAQMPATDSTSTLEQINNYNNEGNSLDQVTNVTQLRDVSPGDWAYEALRELVERYGCIAGYPDGTFRGNRATTRFEFAAGLNSCLNQIERLIAASTADFVTRDDLETLQRLVQEFEAELATLGTRVDNLEGRVGFLEDNQFSTTTKLNGEVIFALSDMFGGEENVDNVDYGDDNNTVFQDRVRLNFDTSFTGSDRLRIRLQARNVQRFTYVGTLTNEGRLGFEGNDGNDVRIDDLAYRFDVGGARVSLIANGGDLDEVAPVLSPFESSGSGSISRFGRFSPIYRMGGGGAGAGVTVGRNSPISVSAAYLAGNAENPSGGSPTESEKGLFSGNYSALGQVTFQPSDAFAIAATYVHMYDNSEDPFTSDSDGVFVGSTGNLRHATGSLASQVNVLERRVVGNSYGIEASFAFSPQLILSGWGAYTNAIVLGLGNADVWTYGVTLALNDLGGEGNTLGLVVGMEPKLTGSDASLAGLIDGATGPNQRKDPDTGLHIEGFYRFSLTDNIAITPGVIWLTAPGHNNNNDDIIIGTIRTTFSF
ncbi:MAG: iron uptake porin [Kastovskya adunca ATA6-11-RM4]|jgi:hypothetical protein|nr:iron uptake porin [Kastovskya adunca ATA6-11-RM4]